MTKILIDYCQDRHLSFSLRYSNSKLSPFSLKIKDRNNNKVFLKKSINLTDLITKGIEEIKRLPILISIENDQSE